MTTSYGDMQSLIKGVDGEKAEEQLRWWGICLADAERLALEAYADGASATKPSEYIAATSRADLHRKRAELYEKILLRCLAPVELGALVVWAVQQLGTDLKVGLEGLESRAKAE